MTKHELATSVASSTGVARETVSLILEQTAETIMTALEADEQVFMRGFGCFKNQKRAAKKGRNVSKGTSVDIPARNKPSFKPYREFTERVNY